MAANLTKRFGNISFIIKRKILSIRAMGSKATIPATGNLPSSVEPIVQDAKHAVNKNRTIPPFPEDNEVAMFGMGCFWGAEKLFWQMKGVYSTQVGYSGGKTVNPTYKQVCTGNSGHNEVVRVVFDPKTLPYQEILKEFWQNHNPTQGNRQGSDIGTQYRSGIYYYNQKQRESGEKSKNTYQKELNRAGHGTITTEIQKAGDFYYAEDYHQQYLHKNPKGQCEMFGTGVNFILD